MISPSGQTEQATSRMAMIGPIMAGMMIFFVFFMGANGAESIIREHEEGTLARLFTTPASASTILAGKFTGVFVTLLIQTTVLLGASTLIFHISWGKPLSVGLATFGLLVAATGFGVMLMSFIKSTRQAGLILGGVLTLTANDRGADHKWHSQCPQGHGYDRTDHAARMGHACLEAEPGREQRQCTPSCQPLCSYFWAVSSLPLD